MKKCLNRSTHHVDGVGSRTMFPESELSTTKVRLNRFTSPVHNKSGVNLVHSV